MGSIYTLLFPTSTDAVDLLSMILVSRIIYAYTYMTNKKLQEPEVCMWKNGHKEDIQYTDICNK